MKPFNIEGIKRRNAAIKGWNKRNKSPHKLELQVARSSSAMDYAVTQ